MSLSKQFPTWTCRGHSFSGSATRGVLGGGSRWHLVSPALDRRVKSYAMARRVLCCLICSPWFLSFGYCLLLPCCDTRLQDSSPAMWREPPNLKIRKPQSRASQSPTSQFQVRCILWKLCLDSLLRWCLSMLG